MPSYAWTTCRCLCICVCEDQRTCTLWSERCCTAARCNSIHQQVSITFSKDYNPLVILPPKSPSPSLTASTLKQPKAVFAIIHLFSLKFEVNNTKRLHKYQTPCADRVSQNGFYVTGISTVKKNKTD